MQLQFRRAITPKEIRSLIRFDHRAFHAYPADWFDRNTWEMFESWWLILGRRKVGCCALERDVDFQGDVRPDVENPPRLGSLYIASTGILPEFRRLGLGNLMKSWQISYARYHGFKRIITNTRKSNKPMIHLNKEFGFTTVRVTRGYYQQPCESTVVMERSLVSRR